MTTRVRAMQTRGAEKPVYYPESDGKPMAETPEHRDLLMDLILVFKRHFAGRGDVYVSGNMMMYDIEGNPRHSFSSDVFVTLGVPALPERRVYKVWEDGPPTVVFELTSVSSRRTDRVRKRGRYAGMGVREYFIYDPLREYLRPPLQGFELVNGLLERLAPEADGSLVSQALGVRLQPAGVTLHVIDLITGARVLPPQDQSAVDARLRAEAEQAAIDAHLRADAEARRADALAQRADAATQIAANAQLRADAAAQIAADAQLRANAEARGTELERSLRVHAEAQAETDRRLRADAEARLAEMERRLREIGAD